MSELVEAQTEIFALLKQKEEQLLSIRASDEPLIEKWQKFLGVILPIQIMVIRKHGYAGDQKGLAEFNEKVVREAQTDLELKKLNEGKWLYLFKTTFGLNEVKAISLEDAQKMTREIADAMTSEEFLQKIDEVMATLQEGSMLERRQRLLDVLLPVQMEVMERYGFPGEEGYIQAQRAMMDYFFDPVVIKQAQRAQDTIFKRAKLMG
ncbi:protein C10 [Simkania sp.]|uniref:protein C10 n=1 Tax=Simkania sp. TaxID=34094 RepID=UPI003B51E1A7